ncbi:MAG: NAD(P)-binding protein [Patescibacteria group bacterium]|jgi:hypothetical protein
MSLEKNKIIRIEEIYLKLNEDEKKLTAKIAVILGIGEKEIVSYGLVKRAIDSRKRNDIILVYSVDVLVKNPKEIKKFNPRNRVRFVEPFVYEIKKVTAPENRPIVVGTGPCGLFAAYVLANAGLKPLVIERGADVESRAKIVENFLQKRELNTQTNIQFGEGGAGTFSDGKLYTLVNNPRSGYIFSELINAGAPKEIAFNATPHIGTDKLRLIVKNIRQKIIALGGEVRFNTCLTDLEIKNGRISGVILNGEEKISTETIVLATGHSARDTYQMLFDRQIEMKAKPFAIGVRIEHLAEMINRAQYGAFYDNKKLGTAKYKIVEHMEGERSVYSFCMCPGGYVMGATSEEGMVVTNGMSEYRQDGTNSNAALLVSVLPEDFPSKHPLSGVEFQRQWEKKAFVAGGSNYNAPAQLVGDFLLNKASIKIGEIKPTYRPGTTLTSLDECLPDFVLNSLRKAIPLMERKIKGFSNPEAVLTGVETRSSAPVRLFRDEKFESNILGLYPAGEGAGYAGGIVSSALDGLAVAEAVIDKYLL